MVTVRTTAAEGWTFETIVPYAENLEVSLVAETGPATVNDRQVVTRQYAMSGPDGYVIATTGGEGRVPGVSTFESVPLFVDIGVEGPTGGPMDGFATTLLPADAVGNRPLGARGSGRAWSVAVVAATSRSA